MLVFIIMQTEFKPKSYGSRTITISSSSFSGESNSIGYSTIGRKVKPLRCDQGVLQKIQNIISKVFEVFHTMLKEGKEIPGSLCNAVFLASKVQIRLTLEKMIARNTNIKNSLSLSEIAQWAILSREENFDQELEKIQNKNALFASYMNEFQDIEQKMMVLKQSLADNEPKLEQAKLNLDELLNKLPDFINFDNQLSLDDQVEKEEKNLIELEQKKLILEYQTHLLSTYVKASESYSQLGALAFKECFLCPYTNEPLSDAVTVIMEKGTLTMSASYLGLQILEGKLVNIPDAKISKEAEFIMQHMVFCKLDFATADLASIFASLDPSKINAINLNHPTLLEPISLEPFEDPKSLPCGHAVNNENIHHLPNGCPLCRENIYDILISDHRILEGVVEILKKDKENLELKNALHIFKTNGDLIEKETVLETMFKLAEKENIISILKTSKNFVETEKNIIEAVSNELVNNVKLIEKDKEDVKTISKELSECCVQIAAYQEAKSLLPSILLANSSFNDYQEVCAQQKVKLANLALKAIETKEKLEKIQAPEQFKLVAEQTKELVEAYKRQDNPEVIFAMEKAKGEILAIQEQKILEAEFALLYLEKEEVSNTTILEGELEKLGVFGIFGNNERVRQEGINLLT